MYRSYRSAATLIKWSCRPYYNAQIQAPFLIVDSAIHQKNDQQDDEYLRNRHLYPLRLVFTSDGVGVVSGVVRALMT